MRTFDTVYNLYFDITFDIAFETEFTSVLHASPSYDLNTESSAVSVANERTLVIVTIIYTNILTSSEYSAVSILIRLQMQILKPYYTCYCFIFIESLGEPTGFLESVTMISDIVPRLLLLLIPKRNYTLIHSVDIYFGVNFGASLCSLLTFHGTIRLIVLTLIFIVSLVNVYLSYDEYFTSGECVVIQKMVLTPYMDILLNG